MGFYVHKSFKLGPIRFNLSRSGVGVSAGVKGARFGIDAEGKKYVHVGRGGIYYRQTLEDSPEVESSESGSQGAGLGWGTLLVILVGLFVLYRLLLD